MYSNLHIIKTKIAVIFINFTTCVKHIMTQIFLEFEEIEIAEDFCTNIRNKEA